MATWSDIDEVVAALPATERATAYGHRAWRVKKRMLVWERPLRAADLEALGPDAPRGDIIGIRTGAVSDKEELIAALPEVFFTTPHFARHPAVLARLAELPVDVLRELVNEEWARSAPKRVVAAHLAGRAEP